MIIYLNQGFFNLSEDDEMPQGAVEVGEEHYNTLFKGQSKGKWIMPDESGYPILVEPAPSDYHELKNGKWEISPENLTALLNQKKNELLQLIASKADNFTKQYLVGYSDSEIKSFYRQEREARGELPEMLLTEIFEGRDDLQNIADLKKKVIEKADLFAIIMGKLFAIKQNFEKHIEQAETLEQLEKIEQEINQWQKL